MLPKRSVRYFFHLTMHLTPYTTLSTGLAAVGGASAINAGLATSAVVSAARARTTRVVVRGCTCAHAEIVLECAEHMTMRMQDTAPVCGV